MKEEILKKVEELFDLLKQSKVPGMFVANLGDEAVKATNVSKNKLAQLLIIQLDDDEELQDEFLQQMELVAAETKTNENVVTDISKA